MNGMTTVRVGEVRPSQLLFTTGIGSVIDLPHLSAMVMGIDEWRRQHMKEVYEPRLLQAVNALLGPSVRKLMLPPVPPDTDEAATNPFSEYARVGVPVAPFPRWMRCPRCNLLAEIRSGLFELKVDTFRPDRVRYVHANCSRARGKPPTVLPARFLVACDHGHLDDFPWVAYVHGGPGCAAPKLRMREFGVSGEALDIEVSCTECGAQRRMGDAFARAPRIPLPACSRFHPHLRQTETEECKGRVKAILLGASNSWFPITLSALHIPSTENPIDRLVEEHWRVLQHIAEVRDIDLLRKMGQLIAFAGIPTDRILQAIQARRQPLQSGADGYNDLKTEEWLVLRDPTHARMGPDFTLRRVDVPSKYRHLIEDVVLVERLREVRAMVGFTRLESPGEYTEIDEMPAEQRAPISRHSPRWVPVSEVRGEGLFMRFRESTLEAWVNSAACQSRSAAFARAHREWRDRRGIKNPAAGFPGLRYALLHTFSHALMRQFSLECGYPAASIRERIYSADVGEPGGPMAGILLYTAAPDSEGTLGGMVALGEPDTLGRHIDHLLEQNRICASDPLCAEHLPPQDGLTVHGAACHACLFAPETSCERGNRFLDRSLVVETFRTGVTPFFHPTGGDAER